MLILAYDTETTGLIRGSDYTNPSAPFLASIAMILYDYVESKIVASLNMPIKPEGWTMPEEAANINGLTDLYLSTVGAPASVVLPNAIALASRADLLVAHNIDFDTKVIAAALWRHLINENVKEEDAHTLIKGWLNKSVYCTMQSSKQIVNARNAKGNLKYPKLTEAYKFFFGRELDRAHSANADAVAVLEVYLALQSHKD